MIIMLNWQLKINFNQIHIKGQLLKLEKLDNNKTN